MSSLKSTLICLFGLLWAQIASAAEVPPPKFDPKNIVADLEMCPVKSVKFDRKVFNVESLTEMPDVLVTGGVSKQCQDAALANLVGCFMDGSLAIMTGCCSQDCSTAIKKSLGTGCFETYVAAICNNATATKFQTGLFNAAKRCGNYTASCQGVPKLVPKPTALNKTAAAAAENVTSNATDVSAEPAAPAEANASTAPAGTAPAASKPAGNSATLGVPCSLVLYTLGAVVALLLAAMQ